METKDSVNRWQYKSNYAYLSTDFGRDLAMKKFNLTLEQLEALVGRNKKGKRKGQLKGKIVWDKITKGGWVKTGAYDWEQMRGNGFVVAPGLCFGFAIIDDYAKDWLKLAHETSVVDEHHHIIEPQKSLIRLLEFKSQQRTLNEKL